MAIKRGKWTKEYKFKGQVFSTYLAAKKAAQAEANVSGTRQDFYLMGFTAKGGKSWKPYFVMPHKSARKNPSPVASLKSLIGSTVKIAKQGNRIVAHVLKGGGIRARVSRRMKNPTRKSKWYTAGKKAWEKKTASGDVRFYNMDDAWNAQRGKPKGEEAWWKASYDFRQGFKGK